jgi:RNA polymerase sigma-70 factor (ECF subfamily)
MVADEEQVAHADGDDRLLAAYAAGDPDAPRVMADRFTAPAFRVALRMLGDRAEAEDVTQEAMIRLFRAAPGWQPGGARVTSWLYRVTANLCLDRLRRQRAIPLDQAPDLPDGRASAEARLTDQARSDALQRALADLPERQRLAVVLRHLEGLANPEIAAILGVGVEAVESLTARGKRALAQALAGRKAALGYEDG